MSLFLLECVYVSARFGISEMDHRDSHPGAVSFLGTARAGNWVLRRTGRWKA